MRNFQLKGCLALAFFLIASCSWAQVKTITGKIVSQDEGKPLAGVSVIVKGKSTGTQTNEEGNFSITAVSSDVLVISSTGYGSQEMKVGNSSDLTIALKPDVSKMGEIVVVGYGTQSRKNVTTAISKLDKEVLASAPRANIGSALQGTISGLQVVNVTGQPGANPKITLRGGASINNPGDPLVLIDGIARPYNDIASEDIESIEVLKDAASTAIYGARANNGVILITTKHGMLGKAEISYKFTQGYNKRRKEYNFLGAKDFIYYNRMADLNSGRSLTQVNSSRGYGLHTDAPNLKSFDIREYNANTAFLLQKGWDTVGDPYGGTIIFKDHNGEIENILFRNTQTQDHYISATGGNDKAKYFSSFNYYQEDGVVVGSSYKRYSGELSGAYKIKPNVEISSGFSASTSSQSGVIGSEVNSMYRTIQLWPTFNPWVDSAKTQPNPGTSANDGNPLYWLSKRELTNESNRFTARASVKWDILPGLYLNGSGSVYLSEKINQSFQRTTQDYSQMLSDVPSSGNTTRPAFAYFGRDFQQQFNLIANYSKSFSQHNLNVMLGTEYFDTKALNIQVYGTKSPTDDIPTVNASTVFVPNSASDIENLNNNYSSRSNYRIISAFGRLNYDYDSKYLLTLVFRQDGVSSLPGANQFGFFPGMSAGWNVHREAFFKESFLSNVISTLKPRGSYGQNGNVAGLGRYEVQGGYGLQGLYSGGSGFLNTNVINNNLRWEKSKTLDFGMDIGLFQNRITFIFDYYDRKTSDLLTNLPLPSYLGFSSVRTNLGTLQNRGFEFAVNANIINQPNGWDWSIGANASFNQNKILKLPPNGQPNNRQGGMQIFDPKTGKVIWVGGFQEGQTMGDLYAYKQVSIFKDQADVNEIAGNRIDMIAQISGPNINYGAGKITPGDVNWLDVDKNDTIDTRDQVYMGNLNPKWTGGFSSTLSFKGFTLYSMFNYAVGHTLYNSALSGILGKTQGTFNSIEMIKNSWTPTNTTTDIPKVYYADQVAAPLGKKNYVRGNSQLYEKGDYLALRELTLSYNFSKSLLSKTDFIKSSRLFVSVNNLFYITKFENGFSPEPTPNGWYSGTYPTPISFVLGAKISF